MDHVHKSTSAKSRLTNAQAAHRGELFNAAIVKRAEREGGTEPAKPSQFVPCRLCQGTGWVETHIDNDRIGHGYACRRCENGWIEVRG